MAEAVTTGNGAYLSVTGISKHFAGVQALDQAQFSCGKGEIHVLIGENGAGKSTLVKIICGVVRKDSGAIFLDGRPIELQDAFDAQKKGIAAVFQELSLIQDLSVAENIFLGNEPTNRFGRIHFGHIYREAADFLNRLGLPNLHPRHLVRDLTLCDKQLVEIAKAAYKNPDVLILDEATSALGEREVEWLFGLMKRLAREQGKAVIFISHRMDELHQVADRATIFRDARYIMTFPWGELKDDEIVEHISGKKNARLEISKSSGAENDYALEVEGASKGGVLKNVSFRLRRGEILGVAGLSGHGQAELLHSLFGDGTLDAGIVKRDGRPVKLNNERQALKNGIVLLPEDRKNDGLILSHSVAMNITLMALNKIQRLGVLLRGQERKGVEDSVEQLQIKVSDTRLPARSLSGGNQQKVVIAKALLVGAKVILMSDPTRGIDIGTKTEIYRLMSELTRKGYSILFYTTEMTELLTLCNRVLVMYEGRIAAELSGDDVTEKNIISKSIGIGGVA
ncbi:MAG: sugar ABC transporter ATP-binding protein [Spirochaetales bacterium]|jgi:ribose transport system ATP-binding protein|nr:sugar ABC transporter ATP-binding protein [Spirochaetales bacterium]